MVVAQGEVWWADLPPPVGSGPGFRRPVIIVQSVSKLPRAKLELVLAGIGAILGL